MRPGWLLLLLAFCACDRRELRPPEEVGYRVFAEAMRRSDAPTAWGAVSLKTKALMEARANAISEASKGVVKNDPAQMMFQTGTHGPALEGVKVLESDGGVAVLEVNAAGETHRIHMVKEGGRWVVDLSDIFREANQP